MKEFHNEHGGTVQTVVSEHHISRITVFVIDHFIYVCNTCSAI